MFAFFENKYKKVRDSFRYHVTEADLCLLREIDAALESILRSDYDQNTSEYNRKNAFFLGELVKCLSFGFFQYEAAVGNPFYRLYRKQIASEDSFNYSGQRKAIAWFSAKDDSIIYDDARKIKARNLKTVFDQFFRDVLDSNKTTLAKDSRGFYLLESIRATKSNDAGRKNSGDPQLLDTSHMNLLLADKSVVYIGSDDGLSATASSSSRMRTLS